MRLGLEQRGRSRGRSLITVLLLVALTVAIVDRTQTSGPFDAVGDYVRDAVGSLGGLWPGNGSPKANTGSKAEDDRLKAQLAEAQGRAAQTADIARDRDGLAALLNLSTPQNVPKVAARVTSIGVSNYDSSIDLDKGASQGIAVGMPVVTARGLVGRVTETSGNYSKVLVLSDSTSNIGVRIGSAGDVGVATGEGGSKLRIDLIDLDSPVKVGDVAVTSGLQGSRFPEGIPVGTVKTVDAGPRDLRKSVALAPFVDPSGLDSVAVLQWHGP